MPDIVDIVILVVGFLVICAIWCVFWETVWIIAGFRRYWTWLSQNRVRVGRKRTSKELRQLIFQMVAENPTWGAPRIHGELQMLGFEVSERTVSRWIRRAPRNPEPAKRWLTFLHNHREVIAAMDFFTVPTFTFGVLYCFFIIAHDRRRILHFNVTRNPSSTWIAAVAGGISLSICSPVLDLRPRREVRLGCNCCGQGDGEPAGSDFFPKPVAERCC